jgi:hypothetical protein
MLIVELCFILRVYLFYLKSKLFIADNEKIKYLSEEFPYTTDRL